MLDPLNSNPSCFSISSGLVPFCLSESIYLDHVRPRCFLCFSCRRDCRFARCAPALGSFSRRYLHFLLTCRFETSSWEPSRPCSSELKKDWRLPESASPTTDQDESSAAPTCKPKASWIALYTRSLPAHGPACSYSPIRHSSARPESWSQSQWTCNYYH